MRPGSSQPITSNRFFGTFNLPVPFVIGYEKASVTPPPVGVAYEHDLGDGTGPESKPL